MSDLSIEILLKRIKDLELYLTHKQLLENRNRRDCNARQETIETIPTGQEVIKKTMDQISMKFTEIDNEFEKERLAWVVKCQLEQERRDKLFAEQKQKQEEKMYEEMLMQERVKARVRAQAKLLEEEAMDELLKEK